jgi:hypothetical protein
VIDFAQWGWGQWYVAAFFVLQFVFPLRKGVDHATDAVAYFFITVFLVMVPFYALLADGFWQ